MKTIDSNVFVLLMLQDSPLKLREPDLEVELIVLIVTQNILVTRLPIPVGNAKFARVVITRCRT